MRCPHHHNITFNCRLRVILLAGCPPYDPRLVVEDSVVPQTNQLAAIVTRAIFKPGQLELCALLVWQFVVTVWKGGI